MAALGSLPFNGPITVLYVDPETLRLARILAANVEAALERARPDPEGTGFGLAIVAEVVDAHGWSIDVGESDAGGLGFEISTADEHGSRAVTTTLD